MIGRTQILATPDGGHLELYAPAGAECAGCRRQDWCLPLVHVASDGCESDAIYVCGGCLAGALAVRLAAHDLARGIPLPDVGGT